MCFGQVIPPTSIEQLPEGYEEHYVELRQQKNLRLARMLRSFGSEKLADRISHDPSIYEETEFVWEKTWIEYINRLAGASLGITLLFAFAFSFIYWKKRRFIPWIVFGIILITGFQGWMGSVVVSTNILPGVLTVHMSLAFLLIAGLIYLYVKTAPGKRITSSFRLGNTMRYALGVLIVLTLIQVFLGTQVRQQMDVVAKSFDMQQRELWIDQLGMVFKIHRSFSMLLLVGNLWLVYQVYRYLSHYFAVYRAAIYLGFFLLMEVLTGMTLAYFDVPAWSQPLHLMFSCLIFGAQVYLFVVLGRNMRIETSRSPST